MKLCVDCAHQLGPCRIEYAGSFTHYPPMCKLLDKDLTQKSKACKKYILAPEEKS